MSNNASADLAQRKRALLAKRLAGIGVTRKTEDDVSRPSVVSFGQQRIWFLERLNPGTAQYNIPGAVQIEGDLNVEILEQAFTEVIRRHQVLRTVFEEHDGQPVPCVQENQQFRVEVIDLQQCESVVLEDQVIRGIERLARKPFDLSKAPLIRARLLKVNSKTHILAVVFHHIVSDGASMEILIRELGSICLDLAAGSQGSLSNLSTSYEQFAQWQRDQQQQGAWKSHLDFWVGKMTPVPVVLELPVDFLRVSDRRGGSKLEYHFNGFVTEKLKQWALKNQSTSFVVLLSVFKMLLSRYCDVTDICVGTPVTNRSRPEYESLIGFFVNTLPLRTSLDGDPSFEEIVNRTRKTVLESLAHSEVPFELLVQNLSPDRVFNQNPLFQVMFSYQSKLEVRQHGISFRPWKFHNAVSKFDLSLYVSEDSNGLSAIFEYDTHLYAPETVEQWARHFENLLDAALSSPDRPLSELNFSKDENEWWIEASSSSRPTIHGEFERQVRRTPESIALVATDGTFTYRELNHHANALAERLRISGLKPGGLAAVLLERSSRLVITLLAVLKTGAAYLPLDPNQPASRNESVLEDGLPDLLLIEQETAELVSQTKIKTVFVDAAESTSNQKFSPSGDLAYVIFTSGSTGRPKGVAVRHSSVIHLLNSIAEETEFCAEDRLLAITTISFDIAALEIFLPLLSGATVHLATTDESRDASLIAQRIEQNSITMLQATPATWRMLFSDGWTGNKSLKILCGGEALPLDLARSLTASTKTAWNVYGPTETTIWSSIWRLPSQVEIVSLGSPVAGTRLMVIDRYGSPVPRGAIGELAIGGDGVAQGYWNNAALTAEKFVPDLKSSSPGARLYRTGDRVRFRNDGSLEYLGRSDDQIKLRGFRIELAEIEAALRSHPEVSDCAVVLDEKGNQSRLNAYLVFEESSISNSDLREYLKSRLPDYMIPSTYVALDVLPLTPAGKVNRRYLKENTQSVIEYRELVAPRTDIETGIAEIWAEALGVSRVGVTDNFFELGGHSLLAAKVISRIRRRFHAEIAFRLFFENPTVEQLADQVQQSGKPAVENRISRRKAGITPPDELSLSQERLYFLNRLSPHAVGYSVSKVAHFPFALDIDILRVSLNRLIQRHEILRTSFSEREGIPYAIVHNQMEAPIQTVIHFSERSKIQDEIDREALKSFDLQQAPLFRVQLIQLAHGESVVSLTMSHLIADAESADILVREIGMFYEAEASGVEVNLTQPAVQYADFAQWQRKKLTPAFTQPLIEHWKQKLEGTSLSLPLPVDRHQRTDDHPGHRLHFVINQELTARIREASQYLNITTFMTLLAAWQAYLSQWTGCDDFLIGTPVSDRTDPDLDGVIGMFAGTVVVRADVRNQPSFYILLERVREIFVDAFAHKDLPFEKLVEVLAPERNFRSSPLFQTMFSMIHSRNAPLEWDALAIQASISKFPLTLTVWDNGDDFHAEFEYDTGLFHRHTIERVSNQFLQLTQDLLNSPNLPIDELLNVDHPKGENPILVPWVLDEIQRRSMEAPHRIAISDESQSITYGDLIDLIESDSTKPGTCTEIEAIKNCSTIVQMLGALSSGAAYTPIDPATPAVRRSSIRKTLSLQQPENRSMESAAYVLFTSGTTGEPKGVVVSRGSLSHFVQAARNRYRILNSDRVLQFSSLSFDASVEEVYVTLAAGATLVIPPSDLLNSIESFVEYCGAQQITILDLPTAFWSELTRAIIAKPLLQLPSTLRLVIIGGEEARSYQVEDWKKIAPQVELINSYGPTETTVVVTTSSLALTDVWNDSSYPAPIGKPLDGIGLYLLDSWLNPVLPGASGEIYIGGPAVARGYIGNPGLTAHQFQPDPFSSIPGSRMYKTGDLGRINHQEELIYLGRRDRQVKVRGFRIELSEIENSLRLHLKVQSCVVLVDGEASEAKLLACVVSDADVSITELKEFLGQHLPDYMIPAGIAVLPEIPRTVSGKVDVSVIRENLQTISNAVITVLDEQLEEIIQSVWSKVLGITARRTDNFFHLGGNSLTALRLSWELQNILKREIPVRQLFETPTPHQLCSWLRVVKTTSHSLPELVKDSVRKVSPLSITQERIWNAVQLLPDSGMYNLNVAVRLSIEVDAVLLATALEDVVERHPALQARFRMESNDPVMDTTLQQSPEVEFFDLTHIPGPGRVPVVRELVSIWRNQTLDLESGKPMRMALLQLGDSDYVLSLTIHHIISDGISVDILFRELIAFYRMYAAGEIPDLPSDQPTYLDYAYWQRNSLSQGSFSPSIKVWTDALAAPRFPIHLAGRKSAVEDEFNFEVDRIEFEIDEFAYNAIRETARLNTVTPFMAILTLVKILTARSASTSDIRIATMAANRSIAGTASMIGLLANVLILRTAIDVDVSFEETLVRVRETVLFAFDHQEIPFETLLDELEVLAPLDRRSLAPIMFLWQYAQQPDSASSKMLFSDSGEEINQNAPTAMATGYDLIWNFEERNGILAGKVIYKSSLFDKGNIQQLIEDFRKLLEGVAKEMIQ